MLHHARPQERDHLRPIGAADLVPFLTKDHLADSQTTYESGATIQQIEIAAPTVLVADDEAQIVDLLCLLLEDEGFRVLRAYDGFQAWRLVQEQHPDLILSDVMMPGLTGVELSRRVKQRGAAAPPMILMSAVPEPNPPAGVSFLAKPFDINQLLDLVMEFTERRAGV